MKIWVYSAVAAALFAGQVVAQSDGTPGPERQLRNIFRDFLIAKDCADSQRRFSPTDLQSLTGAVKDYAEKSGIPHDVRDGLFNQAMQDQQDVIQFVQFRRDELCVETRQKLTDLFPDAFKHSDNPF